MNKRQKEVLQSQLDSEAKTLKELKQVYKKAREDVLANIKALEARTDVENLESIVYQKQYQEALKKQIDGILDVMNTEQFTTISDYLSECYEEGYVGVMYDLHGQGIPLVMPINQKQVAEAIQTDSKLSEGLYKRLGVDTKVLKDSIRANVSRGIAASQSWADVARNIENRMNVGLNRSVRIARTEGHRILSKSSFDAQKKAKEKGADIVKQWDATLDKRTRPAHARVDGEIREIDEPFSNGLMFPGDPNGGAGQVINCRCACLQRAKWALDEDELEELKKRAEYYGLDKTQDFEDFKNKYIKAEKEILLQEKINFSPSKTKLEAEDFAKSLGVNADYSGYDLEVANKINQTLLQAKTEFGEHALDALKEIRAYRKGEQTHAWGGYSQKEQRLAIRGIKQKGSLSKMGETLRNKYMDGFFSTTADEHVIRHEVGHAIHFSIGLGTDREITNYMRGRNTYGEVSFYAGQDNYELAAESIAQYFNGSANNTVLGIIDILKRNAKRY